MAHLTLSKITAAAASASAPRLVSPVDRKIGGVDPLGLRQINFILMDEIFPDLNNVARHIRPFVVVSWAWRQAHRIAERSKTGTVRIDEIRDFVDRVEVIYTWSQLLLDPDADLPGSQIISPIVSSKHWRFGGPQWTKRRRERKNSTAFMAAINYGPALKALGWIEPHPNYPDLMIASEAAEPALDAFEAQIKDRLETPAFSQFGSVEVAAKDVTRWAKGWRIDSPTKSERELMANMLFGERAPIQRRKAGALMLAAVEHSKSDDTAVIRREMSGPPATFFPRVELLPSVAAWRRVQIRQLFRYSLESLLYWILFQLTDGPKSTSALAKAFIEQVPNRSGSQSSLWMKASFGRSTGPIELIEFLRSALDDESHRHLPMGIADGLSFCLAEPVEQPLPSERVDRLPIERAVKEANAWIEAPVELFLVHILESWILAQHVYWSVGRGLADARANGKAILRLRVYLEEEGWTLAPGVSLRSIPKPTADRLDTALSLANEAGLLRIDRRRIK